MLKQMKDADQRTRCPRLVPEPAYVVTWARDLR